MYVRLLNLLRHLRFVLQGMYWAHKKVQLLRSPKDISRILRWQDFGQGHTDSYKEPEKAKLIVLSLGNRVLPVCLSPMGNKCYSSQFCKHPNKWSWYENYIQCRNYIRNLKQKANLFHNTYKCNVTTYHDGTHTYIYT